jgi:hypothetical protein
MAKLILVGRKPAACGGQVRVNSGSSSWPVDSSVSAVPSPDANRAGGASGGSHSMKQHRLIEISILSSSGSFDFQVQRGRSRFIRAAAKKAAEPLSRRTVAGLCSNHCASNDLSPVLETAILHHYSQVRLLSQSSRSARSQSVPCGKLPVSVSTVHPILHRLNGSAFCDA